MIRPNRTPTKLEFEIIYWILVGEIFVLLAIFGMFGAMLWHALT